MTEPEMNTANEALTLMDEAITKLLEPHFHAVAGIGDLREAVVNARNAVNKLMTAERQDLGVRL